MRKEELESLLSKWQERLGLRDWRFVLKTVSRLTDSFGDINILYEKRLATITVRTVNPKRLDPYGLFDLERTLVHELVHVFFEPFDKGDDSVERLVIEQAVHALSVALIEADRA